MKTLQPHQTVNKAYAKLKIHQNELEVIRKNLASMLEQVNTNESEEYHKNLIQAFLKETFYGSKYAINTAGAADLVIHTGKTTRTPVGVLIETKKPGNTTEMVREGNCNTKALHELLLYYYRQRIDENNQEIKYLIATDLYEWFIFDATQFEKLFVTNRKWRTLYEKFKTGQLTGTTTDWFYNNIAQPAIESVEHELEPTYFELKAYERFLKPEYSGSYSKLITLYKLLSPETLLKLPFANDSNTLNRPFYDELLHIIGLTEVKEKSKRLIRRKLPEHQNRGSLLENTIDQIKFNDKLSDLKQPEKYGATNAERAYTVALELVLTWINRILFLKLLEAQLLTWQSNAPRFKFLTINRITDFDELSVLFFRVLAVKTDARQPQVIQSFPDIPYLNSSLFEMTPLEHQIFTISNLRDHLTIPLYKRSILKQSSRFKKTTELNALQYLLEFLDAYDFSSESGGNLVQPENKTIINASVLGLIFEKINGYRDGSFFTPGFITMYMARETLQRAVVDKFNQTNGWQCKTLSEVYNKIQDNAAANAVVNSLRICDPAVGSGHFLVSALNELIFIKHELGLLTDDDGKVLHRDYNLEVVNDELVITDTEGNPFEYRPNNQESLRVQKTLFREKQTLIENCLFGVDINPNATKICRLRLWIELLKNAYYKDRQLIELETLPNIDINIKEGNSLISRFALDADLKQALTKSNHTMDEYKLAIQTYHQSTDRGARKELLNLIETIKSDFRTEIQANDPLMKKKLKLETEFAGKYGPSQMFNQVITAAQKKDMTSLAEKIKKLEREIQAVRSNTIYENAFEWRFEFPEVLDYQGNFIGFDVVIGNPPYGLKFSKEEKQYFKNRYSAFDDIYTLFLERGSEIKKTGGKICLIMPIFFLTGDNYIRTRRFIQKNTHMDIGIVLPYDIFNDAYIDTGIFLFNSLNNTNKSDVHSFQPRDKVDIKSFETIKFSKLWDQDWQNNDSLRIIFNPITRQLIHKISKYEDNIDAICYSGRGILAKSELYSKKRVTENCKPVLTGKLDRFKYDEKFNYIQYDDKISERPSDYKIFKGKRLLIRRIVSRKFRIMATLAEQEFINKKDIYNFKIIDKRFPILYVLAIINSNLISFLKVNASNAAKKDDFTQLTLNDIRNIRLPLPPSGQLKIIQELVDQILSSKRRDPSADTADLEAEIDRIVYGLYGLTDEEIKVVEGSTA